MFLASAIERVKFLLLGEGGGRLVEAVSHLVEVAGGDK